MLQRNCLLLRLFLLCARLWMRGVVFFLCKKNKILLLVQVYFYFIFFVALFFVFFCWLSMREMYLRGKSVRSFVVNTLSYFLFQPLLHDWCKKDRGMCYPVCGMMHIKEPLLLIGKSSPCGGSGFPLSLSEWSFTMCPTPYNHK